MTTTNTVTALAISGKGRAARITAFGAIAEQAYTAETGKAAFVATLALALGNAPSTEQTAFARLETTIGVAAVRMPTNELRGAKSIADRIAYVRDLVLNYQAPSVAVAGKVPALRKGKTGWRSAVQHRIIRNAEDRASKYLAELGAGSATTEKAKNDKSRIAKGKPVPRATGSVGKAEAPSHASLVKPEKPVDGIAFAATMLGLISTALQYDNKHAKIRPIEYGEVADLLAALQRVAVKADAAMHVRLAAQQAAA